MSDDSPQHSRPVSAVPDPSANLRALLEQTRSISAEVAAAQLSCSHDDLQAHIRSGTLDAVVLAGQTYVFAGQVSARAMELLEESAIALTRQLPPLRQALRLYLRDSPVVDTYSRALGEGAPLVCAQRGRTNGPTGLRYHTVAFPAAALATYAGQQLDADDRTAGATLTADDRAALSRVPTGRILLDRLVMLDGVDHQQNVTALDEHEQAPGNSRRKSRRVHRWVRIDTAVWPVTLPDAIADRVGEPRPGQRPVVGVHPDLR